MVGTYAVISAGQDTMGHVHVRAPSESQGSHGGEECDQDEPLSGNDSCHILSVQESRFSQQSV